MLVMQDILFLRFARHGTLLLLAGLLTGFCIGKLHSHHLGNAAHLTGLIGGFGLIAVGWLWPRLRLGPRWSQFGAWIFIISMHLSWLGLAVKAALGSAPDAPSNSVGQGAASWDAISGFILLVAAVASVAATLILLAGLRPELQSRDNQK
jgi:(hydroxyamino)benzene mutase